MLERPTEESRRSDAYIDSLLAAHSRVPVALEEGSRPADDVRRAIEVLERSLPRFHPSFLFEELLAARLRGAAEPHPPGQIVQLPAAAARAFVVPRFDRRFLLGGAAIASGVSVAAMLAWRQAARRGRGGVIA